MSSNRGTRNRTRLKKLKKPSDSMDLDDVAYFTTPDEKKHSKKSEFTKSSKSRGTLFGIGKGLKRVERKINSNGKSPMGSQIARSKQMDNYECPVCKKIVQLNEMVEFRDRAYHLDCFKCNSCGEHFPKTKTPKRKKNKLYCNSCFRAVKGSMIFGSPTKLFARSMNRTKGKGTNPRRKDMSGLLLMKEPKKNTFDMFSDKKGFNFEKVIDQIHYLQEHYKEQAMSAVCTDFFLAQLKVGQKQDQIDFFKCICSGLKYLNSKVGAYAMDAGDYQRFDEFFYPLIRKVQNIADNVNFRVDTKVLRNRYQADLRNPYDLRNQTRREVKDTDVFSAKFKFCRNLKEFPFTGKMTTTQRLQLEQKLLPVFEQLCVSRKYSGDVYQIIDSEAVANVAAKIDLDTENGTFAWDKSPSNSRFRSCQIDEFLRVNARVDYFLKDNCHKIDKYLSSTAIAEYWPVGSGMFITRDGRFRILYNSEDHLQIIYSEFDPGLELGKLYTRLANFLKTFEHLYKTKWGSLPVYHMSPKLGFLTSCPTHLGSGFAPNVTLRLDNLVDDGELAIFAKENQFRYKTIDGEEVSLDKRLQRKFHLQKGEVLVRVTPIKRTFETEEIILRNLFKLIPAILEQEDEAAYI